MSEKPHMPPPDPAVVTGRTLTIDSLAFAKAGKRQDGSDDTKSMLRLREVLSDQPASLNWSIVGSQTRDASGAASDWLELRGRLQGSMPCARCLGAVPVSIELDRRYLMVRDEALAARLDGDSDDYDVLVASRRFALGELLEDEALMALPNFVVHSDCQPPAADEEQPQSAFAALAQLRTRDS